MKTEERDLIKSLLAPLASLPEILAQDRQQLAGLLAPLGALPDVVRALARAQGAAAADGDAPAFAAREALDHAMEQLAKHTGVELQAGDTLADVIRRARLATADARLASAQYVRQQIRRAAGLAGDPPGRSEDIVTAFQGNAGGARPTHAELPEMYASGARDGRGQVWRAAGLDGDPPNDAETIVETLRSNARAHAFADLRDALGLQQIELYDDLLERLDRALEAERSQEQVSARLVAEKERAEQRAQELQSELDVRFEEGRAETIQLLAVACGLDACTTYDDLRERIQLEITRGREAGLAQGRIEGAAELERAEQRVQELVSLVEEAKDEGRIELLRTLRDQSGFPPETFVTPELLVSAIRDGLDANVSLRDVRERAQCSVLLALLDECCPGARHERVGLGKVEDLPSGDLRAEIARRWYDVREEALEHVRATEVVEVTILRNAAAMLRTVDGKLRQALLNREIDHEGADTDLLVDRIVAARDAQAKTLDEAEQAYDAIERDLRKALDNADVAHQDSDALQCVELLTLVASKNLNARERLDGALECINAIDAELRRFLSACGEKLTGQERTLDLARRLVDAGPRTVVEVPRSARDGARRELREVVSRLGLAVEIDHLALNEAREVVIRAVQALTFENALGSSAGPQDQFEDSVRLAAARPEAQALTHDAASPDGEGVAMIRVLGQLSTSLGLKHAHVYGASIDADVAATARAIREHYVNARHEDLARGQQVVIDAVCSAFDVRVPNDTSVAHWAGRFKAHVAAGRPPAQVQENLTANQGMVGEPGSAVSADTSSEQRASVLAAVHALGGELPSEPTLGEACQELDTRIATLATWAKDNLPLMALWDAQLVADCPLTFEPLEPGSHDMSDAHEDADDWNSLARDLRAVAEGDDVTGLAGWLQRGWDFRHVLDVVLDRVKHLEDECAKSDDKVENAKSEIDGRVEDLARALYENFPLGVAPQLVARAAQDLADVSDPLVNSVRTLLAGAAGRAHELRTLEDWCALAPAERNRLIDRTRDALAAVAA